MQDPKAIVQILDQAYALTQVLAGQRRYERDEDSHMFDLQSKLRCAIMGLEETPEPAEPTQCLVEWRETYECSAYVTAETKAEAEDIVQADPDRPDMVCELAAVTEVEAKLEEN